MNTVQLKGVFNFPPIPVGRLICPLQSHSRLHSNITCNFMISTLWSPCVSTQMVEGGYTIFILSTQVKQGKVHRILITPLQSHSKLHWKIPVFSLQCFHRNGWNHRGVNFFNPSTQFYYLLGWEGNWKNPQAVLNTCNLCSLEGGEKLGQPILSPPWQG